MRTYRFPVAQNPFTRGAFWGRQSELNEIYRHLQSDPPQSCALIGETYSGKTTLLRRLVDAREPFLPGELAIRKNYTFIYLDCISYDDADLAQMGAYATVLFWWDLYCEVYAKLQPAQHPRLARPDFSPGGRHLETAVEIKFEIEELIRNHHRAVVIVLDNFEGVASLPRRTSHWLRSLCQLTCTLIAASRHLLYLTYQYDARDPQDYSPLWNLFSDPIYLGLMERDEVSAFLQTAREGAQKIVWRQEDIEFIERMAGGHPELLRIVCMHLFEHRVQSQQNQEQGILEFNIARDARPICMRLWAGLNDAALRSELPLVHYQSKTEYENQELSPYQAALIDIIHGREVVESSALFVLEQRGLIEYWKDKWQIFSAIMERFVLEKESMLSVGPAVSVEAWEHSPSLGNQLPETYAHKSQRDMGTPQPTTEMNAQSDRAGEQKQLPTFTYLEGKVYEYLRGHFDQICDREDIKQAVWPTNAPSNSALQKIIERIRDKIEHELENPPHLIAVRRRGYMLRYGILNHEQDRP